MAFNINGGSMRSKETAVKHSAITLFAFLLIISTIFMVKGFIDGHFDSFDNLRAYIEKIQKSKSYTVILFLSILLPLAPDDFLCYFSGLINMSAKKFTAIIIITKPWCILIYSIFFAYFIP